MLVAGSKLRNRYEIVKALGTGGFGDTYLAKDRDLPGYPLCVVKHLKPKDPNPAVLQIARRLFNTEAEVLYKLGNSSERIPRLSAHFEEKGEFYLVQEYIDGHDLSRELTPGKQLSESYVIKLLRDILEILVDVHCKDIIHRDIKPANLMRRREDNKIALIDFGAVKEISSLIVNAQGQTLLTVNVGTVGYRPSEQANGRPKACSDIYAVGMIGIQALTGISPHQLPQDNDGEVIWKNRASVSNGLANILSKMVRDHFTQRYATAAEVLQALNSLIAPATMPAVPMSTPTTPAAPSAMKTELSSPTLGTNPFTAKISPGGPTPALGNTPFAIPATPRLSTPTLTTSPFQFTTFTVNARGKIVSSRQGQADVFTEKLDNNVSLEMVSIKGGKFLMGSPETEKERSDDESPQHWVTVQPFFLGKYPITQAQWQAVMGMTLLKNPAYFKGNNRPVETVSWDAAVSFCSILSRRTGRSYRLPSEAEWEYACRAGTTTPFYFGETITPDLVNYNGNNRYAWGPKGVYRKQTTDVGSFPPNAFGLYDMQGNVWEWCQDVWHRDYKYAPSDGSAWESGGESQSRMLRGGSWYCVPRAGRSANRRSYWVNGSYDMGFRVALVPARTI